MKKIINCCANCFFYHTEYDDYAVGSHETNICILANKLKKEDYFIDDEEIKNYRTPKWCPMKEDDYSFKFKEFSNKRLEEIHSIEKEIEILTDIYDEYIDSPEYFEKDNKIKLLYNKYDSLINDDDLDLYEEDNQEEFNKSISEFKNQIASLEDFGAKLNEALNNIGEI